MFSATKYIQWGLGIKGKPSADVLLCSEKIRKVKGKPQRMATGMFITAVSTLVCFVTHQTIRPLQVSVGNSNTQAILLK